MKISPNFHDRNEIKRMLKLGMGAQEISRRLRIELAGVEQHIDSADLKVPKKRKSAA